MQNRDMMRKRAIFLGMVLAFLYLLFCKGEVSEGTIFEIGILQTPLEVEAYWAKEQEAKIAGILGKIDINLCSQEELKLLNGIGEVMAERIILHREEKGAFATIESIMDVNGIGQSRFEEIKEYIMVEE